MVMFIAEDGTGLVDANSLCTLEFANEYFTLRGNATWADLFTDAKKIALVKATDYFEMRFATKLKDLPLTETQSLSFPRDGDVAMPPNMLKAICEYAVIAAKAELANNIDTELQINTRTERTVGSIKTVDVIERPYNLPETRKQFSQYIMADNLAKTLLSNTTNSGRLIR
jgi:hypothetical protein